MLAVRVADVACAEEGDSRDCTVDEAATDHECSGWRWRCLASAHGDTAYYNLLLTGFQSITYGRTFVTSGRSFLPKSIGEMFEELPSPAAPASHARGGSSVPVHLQLAFLCAIKPNGF